MYTLSPSVALFVNKRGASSLPEGAMASWGLTYKLQSFRNIFSKMKNHFTNPIFCATIQVKTKVFDLDRR